MCSWRDPQEIPEALRVAKQARGPGSGRGPQHVRHRLRMPSNGQAHGQTVAKRDETRGVRLGATMDADGV